MKNFQYRYFHLIYWVGEVLFFSILWGTRYNNYWICFYNELFFLPAKMGVTYVTLYYTIPKLLYKQKYTRLVIVGILTMFLGGLFQRVLVFYLPVPGLGLTNPDSILFDPTDILHHIINITSVMIIPVVLKLHSHQLENEHKVLILSREKAKAELLFLRNQIQPHFFFNVLNDLYAMALKQSDKTAEMILELSDLMRYVLKESTGDLVLLEKELNYIQHYINLEKLRYGKRIKVETHFNGDFSRHSIAPLLLLPFVENAFKHSATNNITGDWVKINVSVSGNEFVLLVENSFDPEVKNPYPISSGIGIKNVCGRLDILYPGKHHFESKAFHNKYSSKLTITV